MATSRRRQNEEVYSFAASHDVIPVARKVSSSSVKCPCDMTLCARCTNADSTMMRQGKASPRRVDSGTTRLVIPCAIRTSTSACAEGKSGAVVKTCHLDCDMLGLVV